MKLVNASVGKIGTCISGPKQYLHENLKLGEVALCIARDEAQPHGKPLIWLIGGIESLIDYVSLARDKNELDEQDIIILLARLDEAKKAMPTTAVARLASVVGVTVDELKEFIDVAQVAVTAPIEGIKDFSSSNPKWISKTTSHDSPH